MQTQHSKTFALTRPIEQRIGLLSFALILLVALASPLWAHGYKLGDLEIGHPWSRETPDGANVAAGYLVIKNNGTTDDRLIAVSAGISGKGEIHEMSINADGVMTMREVKEIVIPAGGEVALKPGSFHLMFVGLKAPAVKDQKFPGTLTFEKAGKIDVEFKVEAKAGEMDHSAHGG
jgi:periplasmic copper chaperone A